MILPHPNTTKHTLEIQYQHLDMNCPFCNSEETQVKNTRQTHKGLSLWRRRQCQNCKEIFTTYEKISLSYLKVIKNNNNRVYYSHAKLFSSIYHSTLLLKNVDRGQMGKLTEKITKQVEEKIIKKKTKEITSKDIFHTVTKTLKKYNINIFLAYLSHFRNSKPKIKI